MQSDGNSFCGDIVLDSFSKSYQDKDRILDKMEKSKYVRIFFTKILIIYNNIGICILTQQ